MHPKDQKRELRLAIKDRLSRISDKERHAESRSVCRRILENLPPDTKAVAAYFPLKDEVDLRPLFEELFQKNIPVYLPRNENAKVVFRKLTDMQALKDGQFGIPEPSLSAEPLVIEGLLIALIPARAYAKDGRRMGRGNGGYDIWIRAERKRNPQTQFWGIALEAQLVNEIPMEEHDETVDMLVTARSAIKCETVKE